MTIVKINNDINGNPRRVVHFLAFNTPAELTDGSITISRKYELALARARKFGGKKFHNKQFGGGIVFQSYSDEDILDTINKALVEDIDDLPLHLTTSA